MAPSRLERGALLPAAPLASIPDGRAIELRGGRGPIVVFLPHSPDCAGCAAYVRDLAARADALGSWGARVMIVVRARVGRASELRESAAGRLLLLEDRSGALGARLDPGAAALLIADEWGEVYHAAGAGLAHELPAPGEIEEWVRFIAIQCPECEGPEGEWRNL
jgi:hypothetical protein